MDISSSFPTDASAPVLLDERPAKRKKAPEPDVPAEPGPFPWAAHVTLHATPEALEQALHAAGLTTPEALLKNSHELDGLLRQVFALDKAQLIDVAKRHKSL